MAASWSVPSPHLCAAEKTVGAPGTPRRPRGVVPPLDLNRPEASREREAKTTRMPCAYPSGPRQVHPGCSLLDAPAPGR